MSYPDVRRVLCRAARRGLLMNKDDLQQIGPGLYTDEDRVVYVSLPEFLAAHKLPDQPEVRTAVLDQIQKEFSREGAATIREID